MEYMFNQVQKVFSYFVILLVFLQIFVFALFGVSYKNTMEIPNKIDFMNNTIVSYIQKNGGWDPTKDNQLLTDLVDHYRLRKYVDTSRITIKRKSQNSTGSPLNTRGDIFVVTTPFKIEVVTPGLLSIKKQVKEGKPRVAQSYVIKYSR